MRRRREDVSGCSGYLNKILLEAEVQDQGAVRVSGEASVSGLQKATFLL